MKFKRAEQELRKCMGMGKLKLEESVLKSECAGGCITKPECYHLDYVCKVCTHSAIMYKQHCILIGSVSVYVCVDHVIAPILSES